MPRVNFLLLLGVLLLVLIFRSSSALASAYVLAVAATSLVASALGFVVIWKLWNWRWPAAALIMAPFFAIDLMFFSATLMKLVEGAWLPVTFGALIVLIMLTWQRGASILVQKTRRTEVTLDTLLRTLEAKPPYIASGTAVFLTSDPEYAPTALLHNLKHNKVMHASNVIVTIINTNTPRVTGEDRVSIADLSPHFKKVTIRCGFMEQPNVPKALAIARKLGWKFDINVYIVLPITKVYKSFPALRHATMARSPLHHACGVSCRRNGVFSDTD